MINHATIRMPGAHRVPRRLAAAAVLALASTVPLLPAAGAGTAQLDHPGVEARQLATTASANDQVGPPSPDIVFDLADDLGWSDLHTGLVNDGHGNDFNETPAIDQLASQGMTFDNAYASLNCAPTRMALLSGLYATRAENNVYTVGDLNSSLTPPTLLFGPRQGRDDGDPSLQDGTTTVGETLQTAGYRTGYIGKFQVTRTADEITADHGFDENFGGSDAGNATNYFAKNQMFNGSVGPELDRFAGDYTQAYIDDDIAPYSTGVTQDQLDALVGTPKQVTDAVADATLDFIDRNDDHPFLAWMASYAVHAPTDVKQARPDLLAKYTAKPPGQAPANPGYASLTEGLDQSVGRLVNHLETTPDPRNPGHDLADNTLVIFTSDNGGSLYYGADNAPLRGTKSELYEGGVRVPWIVWSANPALVKGGTVNHTVINSNDLYPTLAAYAGASLPAGVPLDGRNLQPEFEHGRTFSRPTFGHLPGYLTGQDRVQIPQSYVRDGRYKLTYGYEDQSLTLTDLSKDIGETTNLVSQQPKVAVRLGRELANWLNDNDAPLATLRTGQDPLTITVPPGLTYANGVIQKYRRAVTITVQPGQQVPFVLPNKPA